tara:strand:+ start:3279 stop:3446 length:168 start_codon:yes stop_codon:yes gene_type:complete
MTANNKAIGNIYILIIALCVSSAIDTFKLYSIKSDIVELKKEIAELKLNKGEEIE